MDILSMWLYSKHASIWINFFNLEIFCNPLDETEKLDEIENILYSYYFVKLDTKFNH